MNRRGFLKGLAGVLAAGVAPGVMSNGIASKILMPVRKVWAPPSLADVLSPYKAEGVLKLYSETPPGMLDLFDAEKNLLASISFPVFSPADPLGQRAGGTVVRTGVFSKARYQHPTLGPIWIKDFRLTTNQLVVGNSLSISDFKVVT